MNRRDTRRARALKHLEERFENWPGIIYRNDNLRLSFPHVRQEKKTLEKNNSKDIK